MILYIIDAVVSLILYKNNINSLITSSNIGMNPKNGTVSSTRSKPGTSSGSASRRGATPNTAATVESEGELGIDEAGEGDDEQDIEAELQIGAMGGRSSNDGGLENSEISEDDQDELMNDELEMADGDIADGDGEGEEDRPGEELERDAEAESSEEGGDEDEDEEEEEEDSSGIHIIGGIFALSGVQF